MQICRDRCADNVDRTCRVLPKHLPRSFLIFSQLFNRAVSSPRWQCLQLYSFQNCFLIILLKVVELLLPPKEKIINLRTATRW